MNIKQDFIDTLSYQICLHETEITAYEAKIEFLKEKVDLLRRDRIDAQHQIQNSAGPHAQGCDCPFPYVIDEIGVFKP